ncbi:signal peptide peptidase SppA [Thalassoroseus pseudoceratinae]|uniref:signal peptide peptidase SppA n=1 Tax=Thalassoroseus pseudoceratinae TaxID=2713176 RepID=UPI0014210DFB|nr:signal peptide peptidase SppA [Thalassoroseus pseudoceratinae]
MSTPHEPYPPPPEGGYPLRKEPTAKPSAAKSSLEPDEPARSRKRRKPPGKPRRWGFRFAVLLLLISVAVNFVMFSQYREYFAAMKSPSERLLSGDAESEDKIAVIRIEGTIMPPFTANLLKQIKKATDDDSVKGVLLTVDSPGGLVADSHQIYHRLVELRETGKPIYVAMKRIAASGGYYVSMGCGTEGRIFAEPTTWTGSIGVIIPRYDVSGLADSWKVRSDPLKTGRFKDALSPFRELTAEERQLWGGILNESFERFLTVIDENRETLVRRESAAVAEKPGDNVIPHSLELVAYSNGEATSEDLATGRIFPATEALEKGLVDEIGFEDDALDALQKQLGLENARVVTYSNPLSLLQQLLGFMEVNEPNHDRQRVLTATVPQAMYYFSWVPPVWPMSLETP